MSLSLGSFLMEADFISKAVECNGGLSEEPEVAQESGADQEVPHPEVLPEQSTGEFDFNEFFNLEKTMPGLASVRLSIAKDGTRNSFLFFIYLFLFCMVRHRFTP